MHTPMIASACRSQLPPSLYNVAHVYYGEPWAVGLLYCIRRLISIPTATGIKARSAMNKRSVREGLQGAWLSDVGPDLGEVALAEFLAPWMSIQRFRLVDDREDALLWNWFVDDVYSVRSAYRHQFAGLMSDPLDLGTRQVSVLRMVGGEGLLLDGRSATEEGASSPFSVSALFSGAGDPFSPPTGLCRGETGLGGGPCGVGLPKLEA